MLSGRDQNSALERGVHMVIQTERRDSAWIRILLLVSLKVKYGKCRAECCAFEVIQTFAEAQQGEDWMSATPSIASSVWTADVGVKRCCRHATLVAADNSIRNGRLSTGAMPLATLLTRSSQLASCDLDPGRVSSV